MEFLNSETFEQMAREYNKKYNGVNDVGILENTEDDLFKNAKQIFSKMFNLLKNLRCTFIKYKKFATFFENAEKFKKEVNTFCKTNFNCYVEQCGEEVLPTNHKYCAINMLSCYIESFNFNTQVLQEIDNLTNYLFYSLQEKNEQNLKIEQETKIKIELFISKLYELQQIFKKFTELLKTFYVAIN